MRVGKMVAGDLGGWKKIKSLIARTWRKGGGGIDLLNRETKTGKFSGVELAEQNVQAGEKKKFFENGKHFRGLWKYAENIARMS